jgi:hypothetical protein
MVNTNQITQTTGQLTITVKINNLQVWYIRNIARKRTIHQEILNPTSITDNKAKNPGEKEYISTNS